MKKLDYIDAIRGFAVIGILMIRTCQYGHFDVPAMLRNIVGQGARCVQPFYIASAFIPRIR